MKADLRARVEACGMVEQEPAKTGPQAVARGSRHQSGIVASVDVLEDQSVKAGDVVVKLDDRVASRGSDGPTHRLRGDN